MQLCGSLNILWPCLSLRDWNENWPFPVLWPLLSFPFCWDIECSTFIASSFRIWNSSTGIPSPPLALFTLLLPKSHLASLSRLSGSGWEITPLWLSVSWWSFLYSSSVYSCYLFFISSASVRSIPFVSFIDPHLCMKCSLDILNFLEEISSLSHSITFLFFFCTVLWGMLFFISSCCTMELFIQMAISFLFSFAFYFFSFHSYL